MADELRRGVEKQARRGLYNRRVARGVENEERAFGVPEAAREGEFFCTCGRADCDEVLVLTLEEYRFVREKPYRFVVAPGHALETDDIIFSTDDYQVVEVKPEYRQLAEAITTRIGPAVPL